MFWNSSIHNGIQKSWNLPLGKKLGEHWSNFPTKPEVRRQADGQADTESPIFRSCTFKAGRQVGEGYQWGQGQPPREMGGTWLPVPTVTVIGGLVLRMVCSLDESQSVSLGHPSCGLDIVLRRNTSEPYSLTRQQTFRHLKVTFILPHPLKPPLWFCWLNPPYGMDTEVLFSFLSWPWFARVT